ncbi:hypothetical protein BS47DRAFT_472030 [Hydnum rufescens UP504]|uniref:PH domain-containing protein n=1 Tax=Hydnum rufescens UP504 TaxID=1448309 RepID=A0A9P6E045_9AGAM|nr:hypothetical protein BS47DRAFT_472030 [Hydnum rufescens UP504]
MPLLWFSSKNDKIPGLASARRFFAKGSGPTKISVHTMAYGPDVSTPPSSPVPTEPMSAEAPPYASVPPALESLISHLGVPPDAPPAPGSARHTPDSGYNSAPSSNSDIQPTPVIIPVREPTAIISSHRPARPATAINAADYFKHRQRYQHSEKEMRLSPSITLVRPFPLPLPTLPPVHLTLPRPQGESFSSVLSLYHRVDEHVAHDGEADEGTASEGDEVDDAASDFSGAGSSASGTRLAEAVPAATPNPTPAHSRGSRRLPLDPITSQNPTSFRDALPDPHVHIGVITPKPDSSSEDNFSKPVAPSSSAQTPRPNMVPAGISESPISSSFRPFDLYQRASKSMINLGTLTFVAPVQPKAALNPPPLTPVATETLPPAKGTSRPQAATMRRCSLPNMARTPPPYSALFPIRPRDDEGREKLPTYSCPVHMEGILHRKMEFSRPGIQARDRSWRKLFFVLNGTSLRVYKADPRKVVIKQQLTPDRSKMAGIQIDGSRMETEDEVDISAPHVHFPVEAMSPTTQKQTLAAIAKESAAHRQTQQQMLDWPVEEEPGQWTVDNVEQRAARRTSSNSIASNSRLRPSSILSDSRPTASELT